jgi:hypothetical protein
VGALMLLIALQVSVLGSYPPPVVKKAELPLYPLQMIISLPVQTAVCSDRPAAALTVLVGVQLSVAGLYLPPVLK